MHRNARLTVWAREEIVRRHLEGITQAEIACQLRVSRATVSKWWRRYQADPSGRWFEDRSSRPDFCPHQTSAEVEQTILELRQNHQLGPARIGFRLEMPASTVWKVLRRHRLNRLAFMDRPTGRLVRRYEKATPGELVHLDTKQVARIAEGGAWRVEGADGILRKNPARSRRVGYEHVHAAIDDHSRLAYAEVLPDTKALTCAGFWARAQQWFTDQGISVQAIMTDNWSGYTARAFTDSLTEVEHLRIRPYRPQTNGKVERFNRTLTEEWAYARTYLSSADRAQGLEEWLHIYNHHRGHTAIGGPPISRVNNQRDSYT